MEGLAWKPPEDCETLAKCLAAITTSQRKRFASPKVWAGRTMDIVLNRKICTKTVFWNCAGRHGPISSPVPDKAKHEQARCGKHDLGECSFIGRPVQR